MDSLMHWQLVLVGLGSVDHAWFNAADSAGVAETAAVAAAAAVSFSTCVYMTRRGAAVMPAIGAAISGTCSDRQHGIQTTVHICQLHCGSSTLSCVTAEAVACAAACSNESA
jgi:hypothetical protein